MSYLTNSHTASQLLLHNLDSGGGDLSLPQYTHLSTFPSTQTLQRDDHTGLTADLALVSQSVLQPLILTCFLTKRENRADGWMGAEREGTPELPGLHGPSFLASTLPLGGTAEGTVHKFAANFLVPMFVVESLIPHFQKQRIQTPIWPHRLHCPDPSVPINKIRGKPGGSLQAPGLLSSAGCGDGGWAGTPGYFPTVGHAHSLLGVCYFVLQWQVIGFQAQPSSALPMDKSLGLGGRGGRPAG